MKPEDQIKALAEMDGNHYVNGHDVGEYSHWTGCDPGLYLKSRDAIVPVVIKWCDAGNNRWQKFLDILFSITGDCLTLKASPAKLAEALLRASNKWRDDE